MKCITVIVFRDAGTGLHDGGTDPCPLKELQQGHRCHYIIISLFIKIDLKQTYCSCSNSELISVILLLFLRSTFLLNMSMRKEWLLIMGALLHLTHANNFEFVVRQNHGHRQGGNGHCPPPKCQILKTRRQLKFATMTLTMHKSQVHCSGVMQWWACSWLMSVPLPGEAGRQTCGLFYCLSLLCNNNMATNLLMLTSSYDSRRFAASWLLNGDILAG